VKRFLFDLFYVTGLARIAWHSETPSPLLSLALESGWMKPGQRVLEVGCGLGTNAEWLASRGFDVTAIDLSAAAVRLATRRLGAVGLRGKLFQADFLQGLDEPPFDAVVDRATLHSFPEGDLRRRFAANLGAYVKLGGSALLIEMRPNPNARRNLPPFALDQADMRELFGAPFEVNAVGEEIQSHRVRGDLTLAHWRVYRPATSP
jgi:2-polyprenyl-3-methyl-5-hydroxy-6-metoxy-1,4-benzoquinol methylase